MNELLLKYTSKKPELYAPSTAKFWDDEHISKGMLAAHLDPDSDPASRNHQFIAKSVNWIAQLVPPSQYPALLDLGCGPGLYTERFARLGYQVTGVDLSGRSLEYAKATAEQNNLKIDYQPMDYRELSYEETFDVITLIYCDFSVFSDEDRSLLLHRIYKALKPNGKFIVDVFSIASYEKGMESHDWSFYETGFWSSQPHLCLSSQYRYDECHTRMNQYIILSEASVECYHIWDHTFTTEELNLDFKEAGFQSTMFYANVAGEKYQKDSEIICAVATK